MDLKKLKVTSAAKYNKPSYEIHSTSVQSRKEIWDKQLSIKKLQEEAQRPLSNYEMTNRQLKAQAKQSKEKRLAQFLATFNLGKTLIKKLGLTTQVKYFKDTTLKTLTG